MINYTIPQGLFIGLNNGASSVHVNKFEALPPRHHTTIQSTQKIIHTWVCLHENQKLICSFLKAALLAYNNLVKTLLHVVI